MQRIAALLLFIAIPLLAQVTPGKPLSERVVAYRIDARLNTNQKTLDATEVLTYRNLTGRPLDTFPFHLYFNAFQPKSTFMREVRGAGPKYAWKEEHFGAIEVRKFEVDGMGDLTSQLRFVHPDDDNADDRTVAEVRLPRPIAPGAEITFRIAFHDKLPVTVHRTGYRRNFFFLAQWFPKVGVWWHDAWNCHQFHATTEFFADFGTFDVNVTVPRDYVLGASGDQIGSVDNPDGTKTVSFRGGDIHDFAWTADANYRVFEDTWKGSAGPVHIRLLLQPGHVSQAGRHLDALKGTLERFDRWYGPYPYNRITVVDPAHGADAGGMEYPTLITAGTSWFMPRGLRAVEGVVEHEFGHQYFYGIIATNEFEDAWLDEGINTYVENKVLHSLYGVDDFLEVWGLTGSAFSIRRAGYVSYADMDPMVRKGWQFVSRNSYGNISYGKTATVLETLEVIIGKETLRRALHTYYDRYRFTHPTAEDFLKTVEEVSGQNLRWYFDQAVYGTQVLDYEVLRADSDRVDWFATKPPKAKKGETEYRTTVVVHRKGDFIFPVALAVRFDNGETVREHWDGRDRWARFTYDKKAKLVSAEIDPEHKVLLDKDLFNNSRLAEPETGAKRKLAGYWMLFTQYFAQLLAWLA